MEILHYARECIKTDDELYHYLCRIHTEAKTKARNPYFKDKALCMLLAVYVLSGRKADGATSAPSSEMPSSSEPMPDLVKVLPGLQSLWQQSRDAIRAPNYPKLFTTMYTEVKSYIQQLTRAR